MLQLLKGLLPSTKAARRGDWNTIGGDGRVTAADLAGAGDRLATSFKTATYGFKNATGGWRAAKQTPAHPGRIGSIIIPRGLVVHTTDTYPGGFNAIKKSWTTTVGRGNAATWMIGRSEVDGVVQFASIFRNSNHAGGPNCGRVVTPDGVPHHPNSVYVGVEVDNAGALKGRGGKFYHPDTGKVIPPEDVFIDEKGRPWHKVTDYQMTMLRALWKDLYPVTKPFPIGTRLLIDASYESQGVPWAKPRYVNLVAHASLNPIQKTDPGPQIMEWMKS